MSTPLRVPTGGPVFSVGGHAYAWEEVLLAAELRAELDPLRDQVRDGLAALHRLEAGSGGIPAGDLREAAAAFRYAHDLLAAEELDAWLGKHRLTLSEWTDFLRRRLARERGSEAPHEAEATASEDEVEAALTAESVCSGFLRAAAVRLAEDAALAAAATVAGSDGKASVAEVTRIARAERARVPDRDEVVREVAAHQLDWLRIEAETLELADPEAAREAALCVRVDRRPLVDVAVDCGVAAQEVVLYLGDIEAELRGALVSASPGELVGPFERPGSSLLVQLVSKAEPDPADPELRGRATAALARRAVERELRERVVWHERV